MSKAVPKRIIKLLERRMALSLKLMAVCNEVDGYCRKIGVDFDDPDATLQRMSASIVRQMVRLSQRLM